MILRVNGTTDALEILGPNFLGECVVKVNARIVERIFYSDVHRTVTFEDGRKMAAGIEFASYLIGKLRRGAYREEATR